MIASDILYHPAAICARTLPDAQESDTTATNFTTDTFLLTWERSWHQQPTSGRTWEEQIFWGLGLVRHNPYGSLLSCSTMWSPIIEEHSALCLGDELLFWTLTHSTNTTIFCKISNWWCPTLRQNHWVSGLCPSSGILNPRKHNVSETVICFRPLVRWWRHLLCWVLQKELTSITGYSWGWKQIRFLKHGFVIFRIPDKT
jgi:hypothetical protein